MGTSLFFHILQKSIWNWIDIVSEKVNDDKIRVIASVIVKNSQYLICQRPLNKRHGGLWEFPGGKIRHGESNLDAARRELREELGIEVIGAGKLLFSTMDPGSPYIIEFVEVEIEGIPKVIEHSELRWCKAIEMTQLSFTPADTRFVKEFMLKEDH
jgi:mutator protein MutT